MEANKKSILGCLPKGVFLNLVVGLLVLIIGAILGGPKMTMSKETGQIIFFVLLGAYLFVTFWAIFSLLPKMIAGQLQTRGVYRYVRHPMYGAIIFLLNPALAILLRSWLLLLACVPIYFIWRTGIEPEEKGLIGVFGQSYFNYKKTTWTFFPNLFRINKLAFFTASGLAVFLIAFAFLNSSALYLRAVEWRQEESANLAIKTPVPTISNIPGLPIAQQFYPLPRPKPKYDKPNSIIIEKMNIDAPLVFASGTSQKELNVALNQGVLIYPGSPLPGETGDVFLTGHSSTFPWNETRYGQVFTLLDRLAPGDNVTIYYNQYRYIYQITKKYVTTPDKVTLESGGADKTISLVTCWPIGTAWKRLVVEGVIIE